MDVANELSFGSEPGKVRIDLDTLLVSRGLIQANSGGGKSRLLRWMLEQTHGRVQQIVLDWEGEFGSLREKFDYLICGEGGDIPIDVRTARMLCRRSLDLSVSLIVDLYSLRPDSRRAFVHHFLDELINGTAKDEWRPLLIAIDEIQLLCPERSSGEAESTGAVIDACTLGRKRGFGVIGATQRISKFHKDAAAELKNKFVGNTALDVDVTRSVKDLGLGKNGGPQLKALEPGSFFAVGPAVSREVLLVRSGEIQTSHPEPGKAAPPVPAARGAILQMVAQLKDLQRESEEEARTLDQAKARIHELEKQVKAGGGEYTKEQFDLAIQVAVQPVQSRLEQLETTVAECAQIASLVGNVAGELSDYAQRLGAVLRLEKFIGDAARTEHVAAGIRDDLPAPPPHAPARPASPVVKTEPVEPAKGGIDGRILNAVRFFESIHVPHPSKKHVAALCGVTIGAGHFTNRLGALRSGGLIEYPKPGHIGLTEAGRAKADSPPRWTRKSLHEHWFAKYGGVARKILEEVVRAYPHSVPKQTLADRLGVTIGAGHFTNTLGALRTQGLIDYPQKGMVVAADFLFPEGLK